jgi:hypothetical protein
MYKGINEITNRGLSFELTNFMSFVESVFPARFNQKTIKGDLHIRGNHGIPPWEDFRILQEALHQSTP